MSLVSVLSSALPLVAWIALTAAYNCNPECRNGDCVAYLGELSCQCYGNWTGEACDQFICETANPCLNDGMCTVHPADSSKYMCSCPLGYTGYRCQYRIPDGRQSNCTNDTCSGHGVCYDTLESPEGYHCQCHDNYYGPTCNFTRNVCVELNEDCHGNGFCQVVPDRNGNPYPLCTCYGFFGSPSSWIHFQCRFPNRLDECSPEVFPCKNGGKCSLVDYPEAYTCTCPPAFHGKNCELPFDVCSNETQRCLNGGTCQPDGHYFTCSCPPNFTGERCEFLVDPCFDKPCLNDGQCIASGGKQANGYYLSDVTGHCECLCGFSGKRCEIQPQTQPISSASISTVLDRCLGSPCKSPTSHTKKCLKTPDSNSFYCICENGWGGERCDRDIDECFERPCAEGERCTNVPGTFMCTSVH